MITTIKTVLANIGKGYATANYPADPNAAKVPAGFRGKIEYDPKKCIGCKTCVHVCAGKAIRITENADSFDYAIWDGSCTRCQMCENFCPTGAIHMTEEFHNAYNAEDAYKRAIYEKIPYLKCTECNKTIKPLPELVAQEKLKGEHVAYIERSYICPDCRRKKIAKDLLSGIAR